VIRHVIVHQFDPTRHVVGGIDGFIRDLVEHSGPQHDFSVLGVEREHGFLGDWRTVAVGKRRVEFMPLARLEAGNQRRRVPHSLRLACGLVRYHPGVDKAAVLHTHRAEVGAVVSGLYRDARRIQFIHGDARRAFEWRQETIWRLAPRAYEAVERFAVRRASRTVVMSSTGLRRIARYTPNAILGANWFDGRYFNCRERRPASGPAVIGWAGRLEPPKDPLAAVRVFHELNRRGVRFEAWIAGGGTLEAKVRAAVADYRLAGVVRMIGVLSPDELGRELRRTDVFLMTSLWEGIPRAVIEALACGVPVVSTAVGDVDAYVVEGCNGYVSGTRDANVLAHAVARALELEPGCEIAETVEHLEARRVVPELLTKLVDASPS
jgi:glycosyltransferase involved in cell wall biosynthesis